jgi:hypothetical protein
MSHTSESKLLRAPASAPARAVPFASGRRVEIWEHAGEERLVIRAARGECLLAVRLTDAGAVLSLSGADLEIEAAGRLSLACAELDVRAGAMSVEVEGALVERVGGAVDRRAAGAMSLTGRTAHLEATTGGATIRANDDVAVRGERVLLNSDDPPMPLSFAEFREQQRVLHPVRTTAEVVATDPTAIACPGNEP